MKFVKNTLTLKILASYVVLSAVAIFACVFLYQKLKQDTPNSISEEKEVINTSTIISALYEADSYASLALQSLRKDDYNIYVSKNDSLIASIISLKNKNTLHLFDNQLDTLATLLKQKNANIEQLRLIKITNNKDDALDAILSEFELLEENMSRMTLQNFIKNPEKLSKKQRQAALDYTEYVNSKKTTVATTVIDTMLVSTRKIVSSAKKSNVKLRELLLQKENILVRNDLEVSLQLRTIIANLSSAIYKKQQRELQLKTKAIYTSNLVVRIAGWTGIILILIFSYFIISDFFKAHKLKNELQEQQHKTNLILQSRERLIASVSHDLKTPLTTISGYSRLLDKTNLNDEQITYNNAINENAKYINHLAQDLLDFSKLEANKIRIIKAPFNLHNMLEKVMNGALVLYPNSTIISSLEIEDELKECYFRHDALRIEQVVTNLISNAFKFTETGEIKLKAIIEKQEHTQTIVTISVSDTGIGIKVDRQNDIFNPFTQAGNDIVQNYGGSGLGLAISKKLTALLNGTLSVKSKPNYGSIFSFSIPMQTTQEIKTKVILPPQFKKGIVIDDDLGLLRLLKVLFNQLKIETYCFSSFTALLETPPSDYDFILTDMQMPNHTGFDILQDIKNGVLKKYSNQPLYLMSGNLQYNEKQYLKKGFNGVIAKPFTLESLAYLLKIEMTAILNNTNSKGSENHKIYTSFTTRTLEKFISDTEAMKEIITLFKKETQLNKDILVKAVTAGNDILIQKTTHKMGTMCKQLEAIAVCQALKELEENSKLNSASNLIHTSFKKLEKHINLLIEDLTHYLHQ